MREAWVDMLLRGIHIRESSEDESKSGDCGRDGNLGDIVRDGGGGESGEDTVAV